MIKRRKDGGFTLIELMIVIAVIGILAVVLVPKFGEVKDDAKNAGVETNFHSAQIHVEANIYKWSSPAKDTSAVVTELNKLNMANPVGSASAVSTSAAPGTIVVSASGSGSGYSIKLAAYDDDNIEIRTITITQ